VVPIVGAIVAFTPAGFVTVRSSSSEFPPEGSRVRDGRGRLEGEVSRVFGPTSRPYLLVRPRRAPHPAEGASLLGAEVYRA
jgi:rRNA processing protein Gar1